VKTSRTKMASFSLHNIIHVQTSCTLSRA